MRETIALTLIVLCFVAFTTAIFFGFVVSSQMSTFYVDLLRLPDSREKLMLLNKYQWAWYIPNLVGFVSAVISIVAGIASFVWYKK